MGNDSIPLRRRTVRPGFLALILILTSAALLPGTLTAEDTERPGWTRHPAPIEAPLHRVFFLDEDHGWILTYGGGRLLSTRDGGRTWTVQQSFAADYLETVLFLDRRHGWVTGDYGRIYRTADGGETWHDVSPPIEDLLEKPEDGTSWRDEKRPGWIVSYYGSRFEEPGKGRVWALRFRTENPRETRGRIFFETADAGASWQPLESWPEIPFAQRFHERPQGGGVPESYLDRRRGWKLSRGGKLERTSDGGATWLESKIPAPEVWMWRDLVFLDERNGYAFGDVDRETGAGAIYETRDGGVLWRRLELEITAPHAAALSPSRLWVVGKNGLVLSRSLRPQAPSRADPSPPPDREETPALAARPRPAAGGCPPGS